MDKRKEEIFAQGENACWFSKCGFNNVVRELIRFKELMDEIGEEFFLVGGTCLGVVRNGELIDHDKDIDIGVLGEESLYRIEEKLSKYYDQAHIVGVENGKILWLKNIVGDGILPFEIAAQYIRDDYVFYNRDLGDSWMWPKGRCVWPKRLFDCSEKANCYSVDFNVPSPVGEFLAFFYGENWRTPVNYKDWRHNCNNLYKGWW